MAREVIVKTWCDPCLGEDAHSEGRELPALHLPELPGPKPRVIALCERHEKEVYQPLLNLLLEYGQPVDDDGNPSGPRGRYGQASGPDAVTCPDCGHVSPNRSALSSHSRGQHGKSLAQLLGLPAPYICPECDYASNRPQGLAAHRRAVHGVVGARRLEQEASERQEEDDLFTPEAEIPARKRASRARKKAG
jgi:hypothetical protein